MTAQEAGMIEQTDDEHLQLAATRSRVLYSFNPGDFLRPTVGTGADPD